MLLAVWAAPHLTAPVEAGSEGYQLREAEGVWRLAVGEEMSTEGRLSRPSIFAQLRGHWKDSPKVHGCSLQNKQFPLSLIFNY